MRGGGIVLLLIIASSFKVFSQVFSVGPKNGNLFENDSTVGSVPWDFPIYGKDSDDQRTYADALVLGDTSNYLVVKDFGFSIPLTATIKGIEVCVEKSGTGLLSNIMDYSVKLVKGGCITGAEKVDGSSWRSSDDFVTYGGSSDCWAAGLTPADVNSPNFGVAVSVLLTGISVLPSAAIDHINVKVFYDNPLPVDLLGFTGKRTSNSKAFLSWSTRAETNNSHFNIERSTDCVNWDIRGRVEGAGESNVILSYKWEEDIDNTSYYYRLVQVDYDGKKKPSFQVFISQQVHEDDALKIYPMPVTYSSVVDVPNIEEGVIELYGPNGLIINRSLIQQGKGVIERGDLKKGIYYYVLRSNEKQVSGKICVAD